MIVMGIILMLSLGTAVMAQNVIAHVPIVQQDLAQHEAYRAMQSGIDEYLYEANANPNYIMCNDADVNTGYPGNWTNTGYATLPSGLCSGLVLTNWTQVADLFNRRRGIVVHLRHARGIRVQQLVPLHRG